MRSSKDLQGASVMCTQTQMLVFEMCAGCSISSLPSGHGIYDFQKESHVLIQQTRGCFFNLLRSVMN